MKNITVLVNKERRDTVFSEKYYDRLRKLGKVNIYDRDDFSDRDYVLSFVKGSDVIVTSWGSPKIDESILSACPNLLAVVHAAGSIKPIITDEFIAKKVRIANSAAAIGEGVAESALGFLISACKGFYSLNADTHNGLWQENMFSTVTDFYDAAESNQSRSDFIFDDIWNADKAFRFHDRQDTHYAGHDSTENCCDCSTPDT